LIHLPLWDGTSKVFSKYSNTTVNVERTKARTAALAGLQVQQFFTSLDPDHKGVMSKLKLFKNLRIMLAGAGKENGMDRDTMVDTDTFSGDIFGLRPDQIASIVRDVAIQANGPSGADFTDPVSMVTSQAFSCSILGMLSIYGDN